jgi:solute carrier family 25 uncoupling protein 8/9
MAKEEGFFSLFSGLGAGLQRQMVFASLRIGLFIPVNDYYCSVFKCDKNNSPLLVKILSGLSTGAFGIMVANPFVHIFLIKIGFSQG